MTLEDSSCEQLGLEFQKEPSSSKEDLRAKKRAELLEAVAANALDTTEKRVAQILNLFPETRDSDITLQLTYWRVYESGRYQGGLIDPETYRQLPKLTSLARARAKIQNTYDLFLASPEVRKSRGMLEDTEHERHKGQRQSSGVSSVFVDEAGKTSQNLVLGSFWCLEPMELLRLERTILNWKTKRAFRGEFHFKDIDGSNISDYLAFVDLLVDQLSVFSFKVLTIPRVGLKQMNRVIEDLLFHLLVRGIEHEHSTGRARLPRTLQVWKDLEEEGSDRVMMANLDERLHNASAERFDNQLVVDFLEPMQST